MVEIRMPPDFPEHARLPLRELERRFNISATLARKWRLELGIKVPPGAQKGNRNSVGNASRKKQTHGIDDIEAVRIRLSCTAERCSGQCRRVH